ncbi:MAG: TldD/PmbA family protein [Candidatus Cloacimonetes bacterium]|jgi:TldD protein|nr:TldD/PmbA family protein [Candidatus Cloacimonadota bacterium]
MINIDLKKFEEYFTEYTELRMQENRNIRLTMVNGDMMGNNRSSNSGISARVYKDGSWGFASNADTSDDAIIKVIRSATENANFLSTRENLEKAELPKTNAIDSKDFSTAKPRKSQKEMIDFLNIMDTHIIKEFPKLSSRTIVISNLDMEKKLFTSDGAESYSMTPRTILYVVMTVMNDDQPFELYEVYGGLGQFEDTFDKPEVLFPKLKEQYEHLINKSEGVYAEAGMHDCIMDADLAGILAHEAIGHTTEGDIVKGGSVAGDYLGAKVASDLVTLVDFAHTALDEQCPVPVYVDDEGTKAEDAIIIEDGVLKKFMHNKETALHFDHEVTGNARAYGFYDEPLVRMRNTAILPGKSKLEDMIASIDNGYYLMKSSNGEADSTSEFMFGVVMGYEIKNGKLGKAIKDTTISGVAFDMLKTITMISDDMAWSCGGMCGKKQGIPVGMGGPAIKCKVNIGGK